MTHRFVLGVVPVKVVVWWGETLFSHLEVVLFAEVRMKLRLASIGIEGLRLCPNLFANSVCRVHVMLDV